MHTEHRVFDRETHELFARISGDFNPIHMDAIQARRTHAGAPIVHGIHCLLWILDCFSRSELRQCEVRTLRAQFVQPIYVGDEATLELTPGDGAVRARVLIGIQEVVLVSFGLRDAQKAVGTSMETPRSPALRIPEVPQELSLEQMQGRAGQLAFSDASGEIGPPFPAAVERFNLARVAALACSSSLVGLACSSSLVGMVVPGLHSMFMGLEVSLADAGEELMHSLQFTVASVAARFRSVRIAIRGPGLQGYLDTVSRLPPIRQASIRSLFEKVSRQEFGGCTALVIGGSRGLGEITSKLIAAGGGRVVMTYATGRSDAEAVVAEIRAAGAHCTALVYDALRPATEQLAGLEVFPSHVYYFATPRIYRRKSDLFDAARLAEFDAFYVSGFFDLVKTCARLNSDGIKVFYPSSTFVETRPAGMTEYAMSKAAAEILCQDLPKLVSNVRILSRRLPRLPTDQTSSVVQGQCVNPVEVILPIVREMQR
jgi:acyl dehydratase